MKISSISERLRLLRKQLGLSQTEFANELGLKQRAVSHWERGNAEPSLKIIQLIRQKWSVSLDWLLIGEGPMYLDDSSYQQEEKNKQDIGESIKIWIDNFLKNASEEEKHWFKIQFSKCFPEFLEWMEERKKKYEEKNNV